MDSTETNELCENTYDINANESPEISKISSQKINVIQQLTNIEDTHIKESIDDDKRFVINISMPDKSEVTIMNSPLDTRNEIVKLFCDLTTDICKNIVEKCSNFIERMNRHGEDYTYNKGCPYTDTNTTEHAELKSLFAQNNICIDVFNEIIRDKNIKVSNFVKISPEKSVIIKKLNNEITRYNFFNKHSKNRNKINYIDECINYSKQVCMTVQVQHDNIIKNVAKQIANYMNSRVNVFLDSLESDYNELIHEIFDNAKIESFSEMSNLRTEMQTLIINPLHYTPTAKLFLSNNLVSIQAELRDLEIINTFYEQLNHIDLTLKMKNRFSRLLHNYTTKSNQYLSNFVPILKGYLENLFGNYLMTTNDITLLNYESIINNHPIFQKSNDIINPTSLITDESLSRKILLYNVLKFDDSDVETTIHVIYEQQFNELTIKMNILFTEINSKISQLFDKFKRIFCIASSNGDINCAEVNELCITLTNQSLPDVELSKFTLTNDMMIILKEIQDFCFYKIKISTRIKIIDVYTESTIRKDMYKFMSSSLANS